MFEYNQHQMKQRWNLYNEMHFWKGCGGYALVGSDVHSENCAFVGLLLNVRIHAE